MIDLLKAAMLDQSESVGYLIDGFPRELEQGDRLFKQQVIIIHGHGMFYYVIL